MSTSKELFVRKDADGRPVVRVCVAAETGKFYFETCRPVKAGELLFADNALVSVLYQFEQDTFAAFEAKRLPLQIDWILTWKLLTTKSLQEGKDLCERLPKPGRRSAAHESLVLFQRKERLPDDDRAWVGHILRETRGACGIEETLRVRGMVAKNAGRVCGAVSDTGYGWALFPAAAYAEHSCTPTAHAVHQAGDTVHVYAATSLAAGERVTVRASYPQFAPWYRCMQTAPPFYRQAFVRTQGAFCACAECRETTAWLKECAGAGKDEALDGPMVQRVCEAIDECWKGAGPETPAEAYFATLMEAGTAPVRFLKKGKGDAAERISAAANAANAYGSHGLLLKMREQGASVQRTAEVLLGYLAKVAFYEFFATTANRWAVSVGESGSPPLADDTLVRLLNGFCSRVLVHRMNITLDEATSGKHDLDMFQSILLSETMAFPHLQQMLPGLVAS